MSVDIVSDENVLVLGMPWTGPGPGRPIEPDLLSKRMIDIAIAVAALLLLFPVIAAVWCVLFCATRGDPIFAHRRVGRNGQPFRCFKFRTMVRNGEQVLAAYLASHPEAAGEWRATRKLRRDPRITRIGRLLRISSLDELPQLFNVLSGDMSCVGPRPVVFEELEHYGPYAGNYLTVRPGLTGLWQISGRSDLPYAERVELDTRYVRNWSIGLDLLILLKTLPALAKFRSAV